MAAAMETKKTTKQKGADAEEVAAKFYQNRGYEILARNYRTPMGELDLVAELYGEILFVEVKGREVFRPEYVDLRSWAPKNRKLKRMAKLFLARHDDELNYYRTRIEIVYVTGSRVKVAYEGEPFY